MALTAQQALHSSRYSMRREAFTRTIPSGERVRKTHTTTGETLYLDSNYTRYRAAGTRMAGTRAVAEVARDAVGNTDVHYLHEDHLGSVELVTSSDGQLIEQRVLEAFGKQRAPSAPSGSSGPTRHFTGHEFDGEFRLVNMKARLYDPEIGRFMSADPLSPAMEYWRTVTSGL